MRQGRSAGSAGWPRLLALAALIGAGLFPLPVHSQSPPRPPARMRRRSRCERKPARCWWRRWSGTATAGRSRISARRISGCWKTASSFRSPPSPGRPLPHRRRGRSRTTWFSSSTTPRYPHPIRSRTEGTPPGSRPHGPDPPGTWRRSTRSARSKSLRISRPTPSA